MTNFEKIKAMSIEEMAHLFFKISVCEYTGYFCRFCDTCNDDCIRKIERYLESEVEENG